MARPKKSKPTCEHCGRQFARQGNLDWHLSTHTNTDDSPMNGGDPVSDSCPNCHKLEHTIEQRDTEISRMADDLSDAANALRKPPENPGHQDIAGLIDCPNCGPPALEAFEKNGGAIIRPGELKPQLVGMIKKHFPVFAEGVEIP